MEQSPKKLKGVNLGGWLILEKWMTPSLFAGTDAVDEFTFMQTTDAQKKIEQHRQTFITEDDFKWLAQNGINAIRLPIGYWVFDGDYPFTPTIAYVDWAVTMAEKYHLSLLIDLHGAKGSQNGRDHSGRIGKSEWYKHAEYREDTIKVLEKLAQRYYDSPSVWGIELLNEPKFGLFQWKLRSFYKEAYRRLQRVARPGTAIVFHDAFTPRLLSGALKAVRPYPVVMDIHWYQFASIFQKWISFERYFKKLAKRKHLLTRLQKQQPVVIGEWSVVLSGEILNGRDKKQETAAFKLHADVQQDVYQHAAGWFYWTYKTEGRGIWHFRSLVEDGVITLRD